MESNKFLVGLFDHEDKLINAIRAFKAKGIEITDALTPFPVHGLEHELGYEDSRLHRAGFFFGLTGMTVALSIMTWISTSSYPLNIGGKPHFSLPSFIPITFELTVLFAAVGMVIVYCIRNGLFPGNVPRIFDERITDDRFALTFAMDDDTSKGDLDAIAAILAENGACDIKMKEFEEDGEIFEVETTDFDGDTVVAVAATPTVMPEVDTTVVEEVIEDVSEDEHIENLKAAVGIVEDGRKDDLKIIKGIGPVYEGKLNGLGIFTFEQIAKLNQKAKHAVEQLTGFPGRVDREDWIGQAKELMNK
ncbi:MAG: quinol:electron acceptor oxidoreductase subunit ActD [Chitinophagales bacterium]